MKDEFEKELKSYVRWNVYHPTEMTGILFVLGLISLLFSIPVLFSKLSFYHAIPTILIILTILTVESIRYSRVMKNINFETIIEYKQSIINNKYNEKIYNLQLLVRKLDSSLRSFNEYVKNICPSKTTESLLNEIKNQVDSLHEKKRKLEIRISLLKESKAKLLAKIELYYIQSKSIESLRKDKMIDDNIDEENLNVIKELSIDSLIESIEEYGDIDQFEKSSSSIFNV